MWRTIADYLAVCGREWIRVFREFINIASALQIRFKRNFMQDVKIPNDSDLFGVINFRGCGTVKAANVAADRSEAGMTTVIELRRSLSRCALKTKGQRLRSTQSGGCGHEHPILRETKWQTHMLDIHRGVIRLRVYHINAVDLVVFQIICAREG